MQILQKLVELLVAVLVAAGVTLNVTVEADGNVLTLTNLEKVLWPEDNLTKAHLIDYYRSISPFCCPTLKDGLLSCQGTRMEFTVNIFTRKTGLTIRRGG